MPVCNCRAYLWPHRPGSGKCETPLSSAPKTPFTILRVIRRKGTIAFVETTSGGYAVGVGYVAGQTVDEIRPLLDLYLSNSYTAAERFFEESNG